MSFFITGGLGQLGFELNRILSKEGIETFSPSRTLLDITLNEEVKQAFYTFKSFYRPKGVIHCAAYTHVDGCELNPNWAYGVNTWGSLLMAKESAKYNLPFIFISTDYVFDGEKGRPYREDDTPYPINVYGKSKLLAEEAILSYYPNSYIIRTSWLFGINGHNFILSILKKALKGEDLLVVEDEVGLPTYAKDLAIMILRLLDQGAPPGIYHLANRGMVSRHALAKEVLSLLGWDLNIGGISFRERKGVARRPLYSVLHLGKAQSHVEIRHYQEGLGEYLQELLGKEPQFRKER